MTVRQLVEAFGRWRNRAQSLVLASVYETQGSTYSKVGAQMLIDANGDFQGMLSGGCLEGDLAERARAVAATGTPQAVTYDLGQNDEELWGLGVGCDGLMRIFLQSLRPENDYEPFASMARAFAGDECQLAATVLESTRAGTTPGMTMVVIDGAIAYSDVTDNLTESLFDASMAVLSGGRSCMQSLESAGGTVRVLFTVLRPPPRILVLGGGLDAQPVVSMIRELGWRVIVQDHRPAYIAAGDFGGAERVFNVAADDLATAIDLSNVDAAIVMSHHLDTDRKYLRALADTDIGYIGLLGPRNRRERLLQELGNACASRLHERLHGPAGIDIGADGPASIAVSIVAELHRALMREGASTPPDPAAVSHPAKTP